MILLMMVGFCWLGLSLHIGSQPIIIYHELENEGKQPEDEFLENSFPFEFIVCESSRLHGPNLEKQMWKT